MTNLLRGLAGTEDAIAAGAVEGASVVVLDAGVVPLGLVAEERGFAINWLAENLAGAGGRVGPHAFAGGMRAQTPLSPVHIRASRQPAGDIRLSWMRRGRVEADGWEALDIPLDEAEERYRVEILRSETGQDEVRRSVEVVSPAFTYSAADEIADFGAPRPSLRVRIRQMGRAVPLGIAAEKTITL